MNFVLITAGLLLGAGLLVCLGLFLQLKREIHVLRKTVGETMSQFAQMLTPAIRIPIDPLPPPGSSRQAKSPEIVDNRISSDEVRLRARLRDLRQSPG